MTENNPSPVADRATDSAAGSAEEKRGDGNAPEGAAPGKPLTPAAQRALAEAAERRKAAEAREAKDGPKELGGPKGEEPTRFGDWERGGRAVDF